MKAIKSYRGRFHKKVEPPFSTRVIAKQMPGPRPYTRIKLILSCLKGRLEYLTLSIQRWIQLPIVQSRLVGGVINRPLRMFKRKNAMNAFVLQDANALIIRSTNATECAEIIEDKNSRKIFFSQDQANIFLRVLSKLWRQSQNPP